MANYELGLTASEIDIALQKAHSPTTSITNSTTSDPSLVTSGAVKAALDNQVVVTEDSSAGITDTDAAVPTSAAVLDANQFSLKSGYTTLHSSFQGGNYTSVTKTGVAPSSGFLVIQYSMGDTPVSTPASTVSVGGQSFNMNNYQLTRQTIGYIYDTITGVFTLPIAYNETYYVQSVRSTDVFTVYFKSFRTA